MQPQDPTYAPSYQQPFAPEPVPRTNGWGLSGFVVSLVGLVLTCGLLCPVGLLLSAIGVFKRPRGWAIAGLVVGLAGSMLGASIVALGLISVRMAAALKDVPQELATAATVVTAMQRIEEARAALDRLPDDDEGQDLIDDLRDGWKGPLRYEPVDDSHYELRSAGPDGQFGTPDDRTIDNLEAQLIPGTPPQIELDE